MTREQLEIELAEVVVALQYLRILALRNCLSVSHEEVTKVAAPTCSFHSLPDAVRKHVVKIRKERWNIQ
jgi:hypothetical protein